MLGGIIAWLVSIYQKSQKTLHGEQPDALQRSNRTGLLIASGLITGEALIGIILAIPIAIYERNNVIALISAPIGDWPGLLLLTIIGWYLYRSATKSYHKA